MKKILNQPLKKETTIAKESTMTIVLVHGAFVDGSGWENVYQILKKDGYDVAIVQHPTISLADDVAATKRVIHAQNGPVTLVGHSYGGVVITEAGNDPQVNGLVYVAAFAPDRGESVSMLIKHLRRRPGEARRSSRPEGRGPRRPFHRRR
jgi:pimeloyl-ACP methyl ester carboxylesterase